MHRENNRYLAWVFMKKVKTFTASDVAEELSVTHHQAFRYIRHFVESGYLKHIRGNGKNKRFGGEPKVFTVQSGIEPEFGYIKNKEVYTKTGQQKLWNNMKIARTFTVSSLLSSVDIRKGSAKEYVSSLVKAGYLKVIRPAKRLPNKEGKYLLVRDTGRLAPRRCRDKRGMWDQNEQKFFPYVIATKSNKPQEAHHDVAR